MLTPGACIRRALVSPSPTDDTLARLLHQTSYLFHSLEGRATMGPASAASTLARQVRKMRVAGPRADEVE
eukprot:506662-Lingulodinium_polyedra.AAC.1